jgi:hypothetical protein
MRTTFSGIYLFNDDDFKAQHTLYSLEKCGQRAKQWRNRERESEGERRSFAVNRLQRGQ